MNLIFGLIDSNGCILVFSCLYPLVIHEPTSSDGSTPIRAWCSSKLSVHVITEAAAVSISVVTSSHIELISTVRSWWSLIELLLQACRSFEHRLEKSSLTLSLWLFRDWVLSSYFACLSWSFLFSQQYFSSKTFDSSSFFLFSISA